MDRFGFVCSTGSTFDKTKFVRYGFAESRQGFIAFSSWMNNLRVKYPMVVMVMMVMVMVVMVMVVMVMVVMAIVVMAIVVVVTIAKWGLIELMQYEKFG